MSRSDDTAPAPSHPSAADQPPAMHIDAAGGDDTNRFLPPSLHIGIAEIDAQHATLFRRLVWLKRQCLQHNCLPADDAEGLLAYLHEHFATEERYASEAGADFSEHAKRHQEMMNHVAHALHGAVAGQADVFGVLRYIEYWFERHIAHEDMHLAHHRSPPAGTRKAVSSFTPGPSPNLAT